ncbi:MAG: hypothetical protein FWG19_00910 [Methanomassiliicoccaceae archaeon]|nr:hypothetical protein [Methanomassiliicoccaceae archaeon]
MRKPVIKKKELIARLKKRFNVGEPIFTEDIMKAWSEYSRTRVFQLLKEFCNDGSITKYSTGIYYFQKTAFWGAPLSLNPEDIAKKKYISNNGETIGYYSGLTLLNWIGLLNQVPNTPEIVTVNEKTRVRDVMIGKRRFVVRRAKIRITKKNAPVLQLLEIFNRYDKKLARYQIENLLALIDNKNIDPKILKECAKCFPKRALENLKRSEIGYVASQ